MRRARPLFDDGKPSLAKSHLETARLPDGVAPRELRDCGDGMPGATEVYRDDWRLDFAPVQWNFVASKPNTFRGMHAHLEHWDYLHVISGEMLLGLHDLRPSSPTYRLSAQYRLAGDQPVGITVPPGVAHGFYFASPTAYFYAVSAYWNPSDELGCRWNDPELGLSWPTSDPLLSSRDASASSYGALAAAVADAYAGNVVRP